MVTDDIFPEHTEIVPRSIDLKWLADGFAFARKAGRPLSASEMALSEGALRGADSRIKELEAKLRIATEALRRFSWEGSSVNYPARTALNQIRDWRPGP